MMKLKGMRKILLLAMIMMMAYAECFCWGFFGHKMINYHAVFLLPQGMMKFYKSNIQFLADHATDPDKRRYVLQEEGPRHYIDMDHYGSYPYKDLPLRWEDAKNKYSEDSLHAHGIAPWWIQVEYKKLVKAFAEKDASKILKLSADLGHYIADIHVPLHTSSNHNGQKTDQVGIHGFWESRLPELFATDEYDFVLARASYIRQPSDFIWRIVRESALASDSVLMLEKQLSNHFGADKRYGYEERNGQIVRQYATSYSKKYHQLLNGMVERRMRSSVAAVAAFWYSAWVEAGQPELEKLVALNINLQDAVENDSVQKAFIRGKIIGRSCAN